MRRASRIDANHKKIVAALRDCGATVISLAPVGSNVPDLVVGFRGTNYLLEIKRAELQKYAPHGGERQRIERQKEWRDAWRGQAEIVYDVDQALQVIGLKL